MDFAAQLWHQRRRCAAGAQQVLDMTVAYAKMRVAFGKTIGSYQGVKYPAADMLVALENAKSLTYYAAWNHGHVA